MNKPIPLNLDKSDHNRYVRTRIKLKIPTQYHHEPIISRLVSKHQLEVNIVGALLGANRHSEGWFDLEINGFSENIDLALVDLAESNVEVWYQSGQEIDGW